MRITIEKEFTQEAPVNVAGNATSDSASNTRKLLLGYLKEKSALNKCKLSWEGSEQVAIENIDALTLHGFMLEMEKMGKQVNIQKKTIIEVID